jgi:hypothetical protein
MQQFADELEQQLLPNPEICMNVAISRCKKLPAYAVDHLQRFGFSLGKLDLESQIYALEELEASFNRDLEQLCAGMDIRNRNYRTISLCAGAALVILLM